MFVIIPSQNTENVTLNVNPKSLPQHNRSLFNPNLFVILQKRSSHPYMSYLQTGKSKTKYY